MYTLCFGLIAHDLNYFHHSLVDVDLLHVFRKLTLLQLGKGKDVFHVKFEELAG